MANSPAVTRTRVAHKKAEHRDNTEPSIAINLNFYTAAFLLNGAALVVCPGVQNERW